MVQRYEQKRRLQWYKRGAAYLSYPDIRERVLQDLHHFLIALADMVEDAEEAL